MTEHPCHVPDCGHRCGVCGERVTCTGPEPAANACAAHDDECADCHADNPCRDCKSARYREATSW